MKHSYRLLIAVFLLALSAESGLFAQTLALPGDGKDFWVGYMYPSYNKVGNSSTAGFYGAYLLISSYTDNNVQISYFDKISGVESVGSTYFVAARTGIQVP